ncbi:MAG: hypothetical protein WC966_06640 [Bradymonadales bacterium]
MRNNVEVELGSRLYECELGQIYVECTVGQIKCNNHCVDPKKNAEFCGAKGSCKGEDASAPDYAGVNCGEGKECRGGICACAGSRVLCNGKCIVPQSDKQYCGASGDCVDANAGSPCVDDEESVKTCVASACVVSACKGNRQLCPQNTYEQDRAMPNEYTETY